MSHEGTTASAFPFGIASGDVSHGDVVLWTKVAHAGDAVRWHCAPADGEGAGQSGESRSDAQTGSVHVKVEGLEAGVQYRYWFEAGDARSIDGLFKTIPTDRAVRFAVVSCAKYNSGFFNAYRAIAAMDDIDFVLHLGDYIYEAAQVPTGKQTAGADIGRPMDPLNDCMTAEDYDTRYALYRRDADLVLLHSRHAMMATIDDHELSDNAWLGGAQEHDDAKDGPWIDRSNAAMTVWSDWMPTLRRPVDGDPIWQEIDLGEGGRILLCETRLARSDPSDPKTEQKTALGLPQREWLLDRITTPNDGWTFVALPSMLSDLDAAIGDEDALFALHKLKMAEADSPESFHDLWDSFDFEQDAIMDATGLAERTVVLSGDVHFSAEHVNALRNGGEFIEWTVTSITSPNLDDKMGWPRGAESKNYEAAMLRSLPDMRWCDLDSHGFLLIEAGQQLVSCQWWFVDQVLTISDDIAMGREIVLPTRPEGTEQPVS
ncbi:MAG: alkaline phosphatase D family protein [Rhodoglobus sp.]